MHARQPTHARDSAPLDGASAGPVRSATTKLSASAEPMKPLYVVLREALNDARKNGNAAASARAIADKLGIHHSIVADSLTGERSLMAERALMDPPLAVVEDFVDRALADRRKTLGDPGAVRALLMAVDRIETRRELVNGDELDAVEHAISDAIASLQRLVRERRQ